MLGDLIFWQAYQYPCRYSWYLHLRVRNTNNSQYDQIVPEYEIQNDNHHELILSLRYIFTMKTLLYFDSAQNQENG